MIWESTWAELGELRDVIGDDVIRYYLAEPSKGTGHTVSEVRSAKLGGYNEVHSLKINDKVWSVRDGWRQLSQARRQYPPSLSWYPISSRP